MIRSFHLPVFPPCKQYFTSKTCLWHQRGRGENTWTDYFLNCREVARNHADSILNHASESRKTTDPALSLWSLSPLKCSSHYLVLKTSLQQGFKLPRYFICQCFRPPRSAGREDSDGSTSQHVAVREGMFTSSHYYNTIPLFGAWHVRQVTNTWT